MIRLLEAPPNRTSSEEPKAFVIKGHVVGGGVNQEHYINVQNREESRRERWDRLARVEVADSGRVHRVQQVNK